MARLRNAARTIDRDARADAASLARGRVAGIDAHWHCGMSNASEPVGSLETAIAHTQRLLTANPVLAAEQAREILKVVPGHAPATLLLANALKASGDLAGALAIPDRQRSTPCRMRDARPPNSFGSARAARRSRAHLPGDQTASVHSPRTVQPGRAPG